MILIGETLNSSIPKTLQAVSSRDEAAILRVVRRQAKAGAAFLDVNTALCGGDEIPAMRWLIGLIRDNSDCGILVDSPDPDVILTVLPDCQGRPVIVNSVSIDPKYERLIDAAGERGAGLVCMPSVSGRIPETPGERLEIALRLADALGSFPREALYFDALIEAVATNAEAGRAALETIRSIKASLPGARTICGLSNVSFGLPGRARLNAAFLTMAIACGLDAAILDPANDRVREALAASSAILGEDEYCLDYIAYHRSLQP